jgi:hypothetical protein
VAIPEQIHPSAEASKRSATRIAQRTHHCAWHGHRRYEMLRHGIGKMNFMQPNSAQSSLARVTQEHAPITNQTRLAKFTALIFVATSLLCTVAWVTFLAWITWSLS